MILYVQGAYGRDYEDPFEAFQDWESDKDFRMVGQLSGFTNCHYTQRLVKAGYTVLGFQDKVGEVVGYYSLVHGCQVSSKTALDSFEGQRPQAGG